MQKITDNNISLIEETHTYVLADEPEMEFTSATTFISYFFEAFDKIGIANNLTSTHAKYMEMTAQELVKEWEDVANEGTLIHAEIEKFIKSGIDSSTKPKSKIAIEWIKKGFTDQFDVSTEVIVYSKELCIAGSIDILLYDKKNDAYRILDWKTGKKIDKESFNNKMGHHKATSKIMDCKLTKYSFQLSLYRYILEKHYGLNVSTLIISHITEEKVIHYKTEYFKKEIEEMLKADRSALKKQAEESLTLEYSK